jgi:hypothetical protein
VVSSLVRSLFAVKHKDGRRTVAYSAPIENTFRHESPIIMLDGTDPRGGYFMPAKGEMIYQFMPRI